MRVLVLGSGGREHALVRALRASGSVAAVFAAPGSDAMARDGAVPVEVDGPIDSPEAAVAAARRAGADLVVIGPEAPLVAGAADALRRQGFLVFGPGAEGARLEGSKAWAKAFMQRHGIPTAEAATFEDLAAAEAYIRSRPEPPVVKVDGLAAGKGVVVAGDYDQAVAAARRALGQGAFGEAGRRIVVEERLRGREISVMALVAGSRYVMLAPAQDHKAVYDGGRGPNTGGMGAYSPVPWLDPDLLRQVERDVVAPVVRGLQAEGIDYRGVLYAGLMITPRGIRVLEFNCRFGDPEAQVLLPRLAGDWGGLLAAVATGRLETGTVAWRPVAAVCVVLASAGYPGRYETGLPIHGLEDAEAEEDVILFHAGTRRTDTGWVTAGGRVLGVTALAGTVEEARRRAYAACARIRFPGMHYRTDIAAAVAG